MIQNVSNCHKSERSRIKNDLPYFIVVLVIIWGLPGLVWSFLGEKLRFDKFHHNKRITLKLQRCILGSCAYLCSFSWVPDPILSRQKLLLNTKFAFPGMRFHLKCTHESLWAVFRRQNVPQPGRGWVRLSTSRRRHCGVQRGRFDGNRKLSARPWNLVASLNATSTL